MAAEPRGGLWGALEPGRDLCLTAAAAQEAFPPLFFLFRSFRDVLKLPRVPDDSLNALSCAPSLF